MHTAYGLGSELILWINLQLSVSVLLWHFTWLVCYICAGNRSTIWSIFENIFVQKKRRKNFANELFPFLLVVFNPCGQLSSIQFVRKQCILSTSVINIEECGCYLCSMVKWNVHLEYPQIFLNKQSCHFCLRFPVEYFPVNNAWSKVSFHGNISSGFLC